MADKVSDWVFDIPSGWEIVEPWGGGYALREKNGGLRVLIDWETKADGCAWVHISVSRRSWTPTHEDMARVKDAFLGPQRYAYAVWVPAELHVNIHPHCLHLWHKLEGDGRVLPEFSEILPGIGRSI